MQQGICIPEFYGDLVYKFKKIIGNPNFSDLFKRVVNSFKREWYTLGIMRQTACLQFKKIIGNPNFSDHFKRVVNRFKRAGYTLGILRQTECLVFNQIMVEGFAAHFSCTAVAQASDSMTASM